MLSNWGNIVRHKLKSSLSGKIIYRHPLVTAPHPGHSRHKWVFPFGTHMCSRGLSSCAICVLTFANGVSEVLQCVIWQWDSKAATTMRSRRLKDRTLVHIWGTLPSVCEVGFVPCCLTAVYVVRLCCVHTWTWFVLYWELIRNVMLILLHQPTHALNEIHSWAIIQNTYMFQHRVSILRGPFNTKECRYNTPV
jgi:hypothetical protein